MKAAVSKIAIYKHSLLVMRKFTAAIHLHSSSVVQVRNASAPHMPGGHAQPPTSLQRLAALRTDPVLAPDPEQGSSSLVSMRGSA
jgi:hypothetical protein